MCYKDVGALIDKYGDAPEKIKSFFEFSLLTSTPPEDEPLAGTLGQAETKNLLIGGFRENSIIYAINTGAVPYRLCITDAADRACSTGVDVNAGEEKTITALDLGYMPGWKYFNITNLSPDTEGSYSIAVE